MHNPGRLQTNTPIWICHSVINWIISSNQIIHAVERFFFCVSVSIYRCSVASCPCRLSTMEFGQVMIVCTLTSVHLGGEREAVERSLRYLPTQMPRYSGTSLLIYPPT